MVAQALEGMFNSCILALICFCVQHFADYVLLLKIFKINKLYKTVFNLFLMVL